MFCLIVVINRYFIFYFAGSIKGPGPNPGYSAVMNICSSIIIIIIIGQTDNLLAIIKKNLPAGAYLLGPDNLAVVDLVMECRIRGIRKLKNLIPIIKKDSAICRRNNLRNPCNLPIVNERCAVDKPAIVIEIIRNLFDRIFCGRKMDSPNHRKK